MPHQSLGKGSACSVFTENTKLFHKNYSSLKPACLEQCMFEGMAQLPLQTHIYISTLSDLKSGEMLKVDISPGVYELMGYENGYLFLENTTKLEDIKVVKIFNTRDGDYGMSGTYYNGETSDPNHMRLYNVHICNELLTWIWDAKGRKEFYEEHTNVKRVTSVYYSDVDSWFMDSEDEEDSFDEYSDDDDCCHYSDSFEYHDCNSPARGRRLQKLEEYHNLPVLFYLNREVVDLNKVKMVCEPSAVPVNSKYLFVWRVEEDGNFIGYAVRSILHDMMGDQAGVAIYEGAKAFGNFELPLSYKDIIKYAKEEEVFDSNHKYKCSYSPCSCRTSYSK